MTGKWEIDRHIPISLLVVVMIQTATIVWYASQLSSRVDGMKSRLDEIVLAVNNGILPRAEERIDDLERRISAVEREARGRQGSH